MLQVSASDAPLPPPAARPRVWTVLLVFVLLLVAMSIAGFLFLLAWAMVESLRAATAGQTAEQIQAGVAQLLKETPAQPLALALGSLLNVVVLLAAALLPAALGASAWRERLRVLPASRFPPLALGVTCVAVLLLGEALGAAALLAGVWQDAGPLGMLRDASRSASPAEFVLMLVTMAVGAGLSEELFFRGYLQTRLVARWGRAVGIGLASLAFALVHFDPLHSALAFGLGLFLGWVADRAGSIRPTIAAHALNNAVSFSLSRWGPQEELGQLVGALPLLFLCTAGFVGCVLWLLRLQTKAHERSASAPLPLPAASP